MKKFNQLFCALFLFFSTAITAQEISPSSVFKSSNEISGGVTYSNWSGLSTSFEFRHYFKKNMALSIGVTGNQERENKLHVGFENYIPIGKRLSFYTGIRMYYVKRGLGSVNLSDISGREVEYGIPLAIRYDISDDFVLRFEGEIVNDRLNLFSGNGSTGLHLKFGYKF